MQNAKDSFYMALRNRLAVINPDRTILLRGPVRPGIVVEEAEAPFSPLPSDVFVLRWVGLGIDTDLASTIAAEECEILYQTCGTQSFGGLDRGRALSEMDEELVAILQPYYTPKLNYTPTPPAAMLTQVTAIGAWPIAPHAATVVGAHQSWVQRRVLGDGGDCAAAAVGCARPLCSAPHRL